VEQDVSLIAIKSQTRKMIEKQSDQNFLNTRLYVEERLHVGSKKIASGCIVRC
jgi:hypothetical protein